MASIKRIMYELGIPELRRHGKVPALSGACTHGSYTEHLVNSIIKNDLPSCEGL